MPWIVDSREPCGNLRHAPLRLRNKTTLNGGHINPFDLPVSLYNLTESSGLALINGLPEAYHSQHRFRVTQRATQVGQPSDIEDML